jgi:hypothetical protein
MKDLFVLTADAEMQAVFRSILARPNSLGIRAMDFKIDRHPYRDSGVFGDGPELIRRAIPKGEFRYFIVAFDHQESGCNKAPAECATVVQQRLDSFTFEGLSGVVVIAPELEEWVWCDPASIPRSAEVNTALDPKERLRQAFLKYRKRSPRVQDFERIATRANLAAWNSSTSFRILKETLQNWFPAT